MHVSESGAETSGVSGCLLRHGLPRVRIAGLAGAGLLGHGLDFVKKSASKCAAKAGHQSRVSPNVYSATYQISVDMRISGSEFRR